MYTDIQVGVYLDCFCDGGIGPFCSSTTLSHFKAPSWAKQGRKVLSHFPLTETGLKIELALNTQHMESCFGGGNRHNEYILPSYYCLLRELRAWHCPMQPCVPVAACPALYRRRTIRLCQLQRSR